MDSNYDFQKFADFMNDWDIMEEFSDSVLKGLRFSVIFLEGEGAFCDWMVSFTSNKKMQLAEAEETRKESLRRIFGGYDIEYDPDDYFLSPIDTYCHGLLEVLYSLNNSSRNAACTRNTH